MHLPGVGMAIRSEDIDSLLICEIALFLNQR